MACPPGGSRAWPCAWSSNASARSLRSAHASTGPSGRSWQRPVGRPSQRSSCASVARRSTSPTRRQPNGTSAHFATLGRSCARRGFEHRSARRHRRSRPPRSSRRRAASCRSAPSARCPSPSGCTKARTRRTGMWASSPTCERTPRPWPGSRWARPARSSASATASRSRCPRAASTRPSQRVPRRPTSRSARRPSGATRIPWPARSNRRSCGCTASSGSAPSLRRWRPRSWRPRPSTSPTVPTNCARVRRRRCSRGSRGSTRRAATTVPTRTTRRAAACRPWPMAMSRPFAT